MKSIFLFFLGICSLQFSFAKNISNLNNENLDELIYNSAIVDGCTDENACNYNSLATNDDGSCIYADTTYLEFLNACDSLTWINGITYTESIDAVTHNVINSNECDSSITLFLTITNSSPSITENISACDNFDWNGLNYDSSGTYYYYSSFEEGCGIETLELEITNPSQSIDIQEQCQEFIWIDGITYTENNDSATFTLLNNDGCDSIITLNLTILDTSLNTITLSACENYEWNGTVYTESGIYDQTLTNSSGCDSINRLFLEINTPTYSIDFQNHCNSYTWIDGITYNESNDIATYILTNSKGCDSLVSLNFNLTEVSATQYDTVTDCGSFDWNGLTYTESGNYEYTSINGCENSILNLTIIETYSTIDYQQHCDSYTWNNNTYTESNNTAVYFYTAQNGCDSLVTLNLDIFNSSTSNLTIIDCENYVWNDSTYTESGIYEQTILNSEGCDSTIQLDLTLRGTSYSIDSQTHCEEYTWIDGITYFENNEIATYTLSDSYGCDSVVTLLLEINESEIEYDTISVCGSYSFNGIIYDSTGIYSISNNINDTCKTTILNLTIHSYFDTVINVSTCQPYLWNDSIYNESGTYFFNGLNQYGCDSVETLILTINDNSESYSSEIACDSFLWNDSTYTQSGIYIYNTINTSGCDSLATLDLTINNSSTSTTNITACDNYEWNDSVYTESGAYLYILSKTNGCDSILTLNLTVSTTTSVENNITISEGESYSVGNQTYNTTGIYSDTLQNIYSCDSIITTNLSVIAKTYNCNIDGLECTNPGDGTGYFSSLEACVENCVTSIQENQNIDFVVYPNPFNNETNIMFQNPNEESLTLNLIDLKGRILKKYNNIISNSLTLKKEGLSEGVYIIQLISSNSVSQKALIIK